MTMAAMSGTVMYCLLRNKVDSTPLDKVFIEAEQITGPENTEQSAQTAQAKGSQ